MKLKKVSHFFLALFGLSLIITSISLIYLKIKIDNSPIIVSKNPKLIQKDFSLIERNYITYQKDNRFYFAKDYFQFLILQDLSLKHRELLKEGIQFYYDDLVKPRSVQVVIGNNTEDVWNYSII